VLMSLIASPVKTGYFATSFRVTEVLVLIPILVVSAAFPIIARAARNDSARFAYATARIFELALLAGTWLVLCLEVGAGFAIHVIAGARADPSIAVLRIQGLALIASFAIVACGFPLLSMHRHRAVIYSNLGALAISAALTLALVPSLGARGAAIAAVVAETALAITTALVLMRSQRAVRLPLSAIPVAALAGGAGLLVGLLTPIHPLLEVLLASAVYFGVLRALGRFPGEVRELLGGRLGTLGR
jgi:O-antigen/teichoic acid export membrane protein